jgi:putative tricarboxylic transport membrane protein
MNKTDRQLRLQDGFILYVAIFLLLFLMEVDCRAADPSADYPSRPINYVTHSGPGSSMDILGRLLNDIMQKEKILSQPLVINNRLGSGGAVSYGYVHERKGNPHVVLAVTSTSFICTPILEKLPYNYKSFSLIANMLVDPSFLVVRSDSPFKTANDIVAEAKKRPKMLIQGGGSFSSADSLMGLTIQKLKGVQWNFVSFAGGGTEAVLNVLNGNVHFAFANPQPVLDYIRTGKMRVLLAGAPNRYPEFKDAPTMKEAGFGEPILTYRGIVGPPNMPDYAVKKLEAAFKKVVENDRYKKFLEDTVMQPFWLSTQEWGKLLDEENDRWKVLLSEVDLLKKK